MRAHRAARVLLFVALGVGCAGPSDAPPAPAAPEASPDTSEVETPAPVRGLVATIGTNRLYAPNRELGLGLENVGDEPVDVRQLRLDSPLFETLPMTAREVRLHAGQRFVLPVPFGPARCDGEGKGDRAFVALLVVDAGEEVRLRAVEDHPGSIGRLHRRECAAAEVHELAGIRFGDRWTRDGVAITGELLLEQRRHGTSVAMDDAAGNVIFTLRFEDDAPPVLQVNDEAPIDRAPVTISADRCDAHAVAEFKTPFLFLSWIAVGDADPVPVELEITGPARAALQELLATCSS